MERRKLNKNLIISAFGLITSSLLLVGSSLAWFSLNTNTGNMDFSVLQIDSVVKLYRAIDNNYNGIPNTLDGDDIGTYYESTNGTRVAYGYPYYDEKFDFEFVDEKYALSQNSEANLFIPLALTDVVPSKIYTYKFEVINYSGIETLLQFNFAKSSNVKTERIKTRIGVVDETTTNLKMGNYSTISSTAITSLQPQLDDGETFNVGSHTGESIVGRVDIWLQLVYSSSESEALNIELPEFELVFVADYPDE